MRQNINPRDLLELGSFIWIVFAATLTASGHPLAPAAIIGVIVLSIASIWLRHVERTP